MRASSPSPTASVAVIARPGCGVASLPSTTSTPVLSGSPLAHLGLTGAGPTALVTDAAGDVWFSDTDGGRIGRLVGAHLTLWQLGLHGAPGFLSSDGHDGVWVPDEGTGTIIHITGDGSVTECLLASASSQAYGVAVTNDGSVWVVEMAADAVVHVAPSGQMTSYAVPKPGSGPTDITVGPDGNLWFTVSTGNVVGRLTPAGQMSLFPVPGPASLGGEITTGPDGALWFTEFGSGTVDRISVSGAVQTFPTSVTSPNAIVAGPDGNLWFSASGSNEIDRISTSGTVTKATATGAFPDGLGFVGHDLWFAEYTAGDLARLTNAG